MPTHTAPHPRQDRRAGKPAHHCRVASTQISRTPPIRRIDYATARTAAAAAPTPEQRNQWLALAAASLPEQEQTLIAVDTTAGRVYYAFGEATR